MNEPIKPIHLQEPEKFQRKLMEGMYDWSHTAIRYWPERVLEKCKKEETLSP
jgi:hypothetical protein